MIRAIDCTHNVPVSAHGGLTPARPFMGVLSPPAARQSPADINEPLKAPINIGAAA